MNNYKLYQQQHCIITIKSWQAKEEWEVGAKTLMSSSFHHPFISLCGLHPVITSTTCRHWAWLLHLSAAANVGYNTKHRVHMNESYGTVCWLRGAKHSSVRLFSHNSYPKPPCWLVSPTKPHGRWVQSKGITKTGLGRIGPPHVEKMGRHCIRQAPRVLLEPKPLSCAPLQMSATLLTILAAAYLIIHCNTAPSFWSMTVGAHFDAAQIRWERGVCERVHKTCHWTY